MHVLVHDLSFKIQNRTNLCILIVLGMMKKHNTMCVLLFELTKLFHSFMVQIVHCVGDNVALGGPGAIVVHGCTNKLINLIQCVLSHHNTLALIKA